MFTNFIINDPRKDREYITITEESLTKRCNAMLPADFIAGKSILDVGCALGAMGHWSVLHGCSSYTGIEIQDKYRNKGQELLPNVKFYKFLEETTDKYDIVIAAGIINGVDDQLGFIRKLCDRSNKYVIIETSYLSTQDSIIHVTEDGKMINYNDVAEPYVGISFVPSIQALNIMMKVSGFQFEKRIFPEKITSCHDAYNVFQKSYARCILQYQKSNTYIKSLEEIVRSDNVDI
jgi:hypothetical protein